ncbi:hypothetical protein G6O67_008758 [Ophiocordyceps sinensis]|uniref:Chromo domain-containing protein n=1 Tax=Ophiocordyceps sinensis TaxID=72228 RepID=A0A8H4LSA6_9HYPO|nr:hypothetical protein G6O67_008758 [Ophiocordyceps sinensis]
MLASLFSSRQATPTAKLPAATDSPVAQPTASRDAVEKPRIEKPRIEKPRIEKPRIKPRIEKPKTEKPKTKKPKADKPKTDKPKTDKPKTDKPKTKKPKTKKPKTKKPKTKKPKTKKPKTKKPKTKKPKTKKPKTKKPKTDKPKTKKPKTKKPKTKKPKTKKPKTKKPKTKKPKTKKPETDKPATSAYLRSDDEGDEFPFKRLIKHRWVGDSMAMEIQVEWDGGVKTWEPETNLHADALSSLLQYWVGQGGRPTNPADPEMYDIFAVRRHSPDRKRLFVEWTGYSPKEASWVSCRAVEETAPELLAEYWRKWPRRGPGRPRKKQRR